MGNASSTQLFLLASSLLSEWKPSKCYDNENSDKKYWGNDFWEFISNERPSKGNTMGVRGLLGNLTELVTEFTQQHLIDIPIVADSSKKMWYDDLRVFPRVTAGSKLKLIRAFITKAIPGQFMQNHVDGDCIASLVMVLNDGFTGGHLCISNRDDGQIPDWHRQKEPEVKEKGAPHHHSSFYLKNIPGYSYKSNNLRLGDYAIFLGETSHFVDKLHSGDRYAFVAFFSY